MSSTLGRTDGIRPTADKLPTDKENESRCDECRARITETKTLDEVGHRRDCSVREEKYEGRGSARWAHVGEDE